MRGMAAAFLRSTDGYLGLTRDEAERRATSERERLCVHSGVTGHRMNKTSARVHVKLGGDGRVVLARRDTAPWASPDDWNRLQDDLR
jgi:hypothetical protein